MRGALIALALGANLAGLWVWAWGGCPRRGPGSRSLGEVAPSTVVKNLGLISLSPKHLIRNMGAITDPSSQGCVKSQWGPSGLLLVHSKPSDVSYYLVLLLLP